MEGHERAPAILGALARVARARPSSRLDRRAMAAGVPEDAGRARSCCSQPSEEKLSATTDAPVALVAQYVLPGDVLVRTDVTGQAEHALAENVAHHLGRAALDGV